MIRIILFLLIPFLMYSQSEKEMLEAGIKMGTVKTIIKKFDGSISNAINQWADSGNGKLSKEFVESAEKLGLNKVYLDSKLKLARQERLKQGVIGVLAVATIAVAAATGGGGSNVATSDNSGESNSYYYYNKDYDYSKSKKTYEVSKIENISTNYLDTSYIQNYQSNNNFKSENSIYNEFLHQPIKSQNVVQDNKLVGPIIYGNSSNYINGKNSYNTGFDETGLLNVYDSSGITIGAMKKDDSGVAFYKEGILQRYTSAPDNRGVSVTYNGGIPQSATKYDSEGNMSHYDATGIATGYSKKVRGGYENYDSSGILQSFTSTEDKGTNPLKGIKNK